MHSALKSPSLWILTFLLALLAPQYSVSQLSVVRFRSNLILYDGYDVAKRKVLYTNSEKAMWKDINMMMKDSGLEMKAMLCGVGSGAWVAYPGRDFKADNGSGPVWLMVGETCLAADDVMSVQAVGPINKAFEGLVTYSEINFGSDYKLVSNETSASESGVKSLISPGGMYAMWTVEGDGKKICLVRPQSLTSLGVCVLPDIPTQLGIKSASVKVGCDEGGDMSKMMMFQLETCFGMVGAYRILMNYMPVPVISSICSGSGSPEQKLGFFKIYDAWKFRMNSDRQMEMNPADIDKSRSDDMNPTRMRLLNYFFGIFRESCPLLTAEYFNLVRYIFMQHLKSIWDEAPLVMKDRNDTMYDWRHAEEYLMKCYEARTANPLGTPPEELSCIKTHPDPDEKPEEIHAALDLFLDGDNLDHIMEQVWLMLNLVGPYCGAAIGYTDNFWVDFANLFRRQFLLPLLQQWINPGTWQTYYAYMFHGYDLDKGKRQIITCVQEVISKTPSMDPIDRPSSAAKEFLSVSKKRPPVKLHEEGGMVMGDVKKEPAPQQQPGKKPKKRETKGSKVDPKKMERKGKSKKPHEHNTAQSLIKGQNNKGGSHQPASDRSKPQHKF